MKTIETRKHLELRADNKVIQKWTDTKKNLDIACTTARQYLRKHRSCTHAFVYKVTSSMLYKVRKT